LLRKFVVAILMSDQFSSYTLEGLTTLLRISWKHEPDEFMIDGCSHLLDSSNFRFAQAAPEVSRYRRGLPRHAACQFCSVDMLAFHCVDHLLL